MARKSIISREQIIEAAFEIAKEAGRQAITVREISKKLHISTAPIYTQYNGTDEIYIDLNKYISKKMEESKLTTRSHSPFLDIGLGILRFAYDNRNIFNDYFLTPNLNLFDYSISEEIYLSRMKRSKELSILDDKHLKTILNDMNVYTFGLATQICLDRENTYSFNYYQMRLETAGRSIIGYYIFSSGKFDQFLNKIQKSN